MNLAKIIANNRVKILSQRDKNKFVTLTNQINSLETTDLNEIKWVWEATVKILLENNITSKDDLLKISEEEIKWLKLNLISEKALIKFIQ